MEGKFVGVVTPINCSFVLTWSFMKHVF